MRHDVVEAIANLRSLTLRVGNLRKAPDSESQATVLKLPLAKLVDHEVQVDSSSQTVP